MIQTKPEVYIIYVDANNLYGWAMCQKLPCSHFREFTNEELEALNELNEEGLIAFLETLDAKDEGCYFEVKLKYPEELHDKHNLYPLAPERRPVKKEEVSYFTKELNEKLKVKVDTKTPMLLQTLEDKDHYFVYWKNLLFYLKHGLKVETIYSGVFFKEYPIMKG